MSPTLSLDRPVQFSLAPSRWHCVVVLVGVCIAGVAIVGSPLAFSIQIALLAAVSVLAIRECRRGLLRTSAAVRDFRLMRPDQKEGEPRDGAPTLAVSSLVQDFMGRPRDNTSSLRIAYAMKGRESSGLILGSTVVTPQFVGIRYRLDADRWWQRWPARTLVVWPDSMSSDEFRRLRVLLRHG